MEDGVKRLGFVFGGGKIGQMELKFWEDMRNGEKWLNIY